MPRQQLSYFFLFSPSHEFLAELVIYHSPRMGEAKQREKYFESIFHADGKIIHFATFAAVNHMRAFLGRVRGRPCGNRFLRLIPK